MPDKNEHATNTRRDFLKTTSAAVAAGASLTAASPSTNASDAPKILNYNPKMGYRPLGRRGS